MHLVCFSLLPRSQLKYNCVREDSGDHQGRPPSVSPAVTIQFPHYLPLSTDGLQTPWEQRPQQCIQGAHTAYLTLELLNKTLVTSKQRAPYYSYVLN